MEPQQAWPRSARPNITNIDLTALALGYVERANAYQLNRSHREADGATFAAWLTARQLRSSGFSVRSPAN